MRLIEIERAACEAALFWRPKQRSDERYSSSHIMGFQVFFATTKKQGKSYAYCCPNFHTNP